MTTRKGPHSLAVLEVDPATVPESKPVAMVSTSAQPRRARRRPSGEPSIGVRIEIAGVGLGFAAPGTQLEKLSTRYGAFVETGDATRSHNVKFCRDFRKLDIRIRSALVDKLAEAHGLVIHASAVDTKEGAFLFFGPSGRGKSTIAASAGDAALSDELVVVRKADGLFCAFGTPFWSGRPTHSRLLALLTLEQASENELQPLSPLETLRELLSQTAFPSPSSTRHQHTFAGLTALCREVPGYRLRFRRACDFWPLLRTEPARSAVCSE